MAVPPVLEVETILEPGEKRSKIEPKLEKEERASLFVVAPTVMASGTRAGE
jgi:hypothetical protein